MTDQFSAFTRPMTISQIDYAFQQVGIAPPLPPLEYISAVAGFKAIRLFAKESPAMQLVYRFPFWRRGAVGEIKGQPLLSCRSDIPMFLPTESFRTAYAPGAKIDKQFDSNCINVIANAAYEAYPQFNALKDGAGTVTIKFYEEGEDYWGYSKIFIGTMKIIGGAAATDFQFTFTTARQ
jgi:hypothetical protein